MSESDRGNAVRIDRKWKVIYPCEPFFNRAHHPRSILLLARAWQHLSLRGGHLYSTRVLRETRARRKKERGGGRREEGKGGREKMKWSLYEIRFPKRHPLSTTTPVHVGYQIFLLAFLRNRLLRLLSSYTRATLTHPGCAVKPILETIHITKTYFFHRTTRSHLT